MAKIIDIPGFRMHLIPQISDEGFTERDLKLVASCVLAYATEYNTAFPEETRLSEEETSYLLEAFGYDATVLHLTKREFMLGLTPHYSLAGTHPELVYMLFRTFLDPKFQRHLMNLDFYFPDAPRV